MVGVMGGFYVSSVHIVVGFKTSVSRGAFTLSGVRKN